MRLKLFFLAMLGLGLVSCGQTSNKKKAGKDAADSSDCSDWQGGADLAVFSQVYDASKLVKWDVGPVVGVDKLNRVSFLFERVDKKPVRLEKICFWPYMSVHGHGGVGEPKVIYRDVNKAQFEGFSFQMSGPWELELRVLVDGKRYALSVPVQIERP